MYDEKETSKEEYEARIAELERLNATLLRIVRERGNKAREMPRSASGYIFYSIIQCWDRIVLNEGSMDYPKIRPSQNIKSWKIVCSTPYPLHMPAEDVILAIRYDLDLKVLDDEPVLATNRELLEKLEEYPIYRIFLKATAGNDKWDAVINTIKEKAFLDFIQ